MPINIFKVGADQFQSKLVIANRFGDLKLHSGELASTDEINRMSVFQARALQNKDKRIARIVDQRTDAVLEFVRREAVSELIKSPAEANKKVDPLNYPSAVVFVIEK